MNLIRLVSGSPRSLVVQVSVGISAHMTRKGLFAQWRVNVLDPVAIDWSLVGLADASLPTMLAIATGMLAATALLTAMSVASLVRPSRCE